MFLDLSDPWHDPPPPPPRRERPTPKLTPRRQKALGWIVAFNLAMLLLGPLAGGSVVHAVIAWVRR